MASAKPRPAPAPRRSRRPLTAHPAFAVMLGLWGALLGGLGVVVLPDHLIESTARLASPDLLVSEARLALGALAAVTLGLGCLLVARLVGGRSQRRAAQDLRAIDPASELGSDSLDAPLGDLPPDFLTRAAAWGDEADNAADDAEDEAASNWLPPRSAFDTASQGAEAWDDLTAAWDTPEPAPTPSALTPPLPRELDLSGFAELPGRNAVWVEEPPSAAPQPRSDPAPSAIARLRAVPPQELSLVQMVERFAAALQDYQAAQDTADAGADALTNGRDQREALLHAALSALGEVTQRSENEQQAATRPQWRAQLWAQALHSSNERGAA